ncbi:helix-turn-helix domain-containing protein [Mucilaginibacter celer]|uniref:Helix-turn-helix domain-containing protein n=1 Tax=Mucilaginibacter celer TaxID=2305508 RepID=A0A494VUP6_9SPHI|nr:AraC family transcriptional regulator [Mucilaginibacter celer]AYL95018.1 helix-turn-helix domain-containing protein [Mucilaginibacter celer]
MALPAQTQFFPLHPLLEPYVSVLVLTELKVTETGGYIDIFPVGYGVLSFIMDDTLPSFLDIDKSLPKFSLTGQLTRYYRHYFTPGNYRFFSAILKPYGAYRLLDTRQDAIVDNFIAIQDIIADGVAEFCDHMQTLSDQPEAGMRLLEQWLLHRLEVPVKQVKLNEIIAACRIIDAADGVKPIKEICTETGISKSSLERHFLEKIGLTPKMYSRIIRFNKVYQTLKFGTYNNWQDVVYKFNFYDQAHFINDFKSFFNYTPSEIHKSRLNSEGVLGSAG